MTVGAVSLHLCCDLEGHNRHTDYTISKYLTSLVLSQLNIAEINMVFMFLKGKIL